MMRSEVDGLYGAWLTLHGGPHPVPDTLEGSLDFLIGAPSGLEVKQPYAAHIIATDSLGGFVAAERGEESVYSLARRSGVPTSTIFALEQGKTQVVYKTTVALYHALGGGSLYLAFFEGGTPAISTGQTVFIAEQENYSRIAGSYFRTLRTSLPGSPGQEEMAARLDISQPQMSRFERGGDRTPSKPSTIADRFSRGLSVPVAFCGIKPPPA